MSKEKQSLLRSAVTLVLYANWLPSEAASKFGVSTRAVYKAVREAQVKPDEQKQKLETAKEKLLNHLLQIDLKLAEL